MDAGPKEEGRDKDLCSERKQQEGIDHQRTTATRVSPEEEERENSLYYYYPRRTMIACRWSQNLWGWVLVLATEAIDGPEASNSKTQTKGGEKQGLAPRKKAVGDPPVEKDNSSKAQIPGEGHVPVLANETGGRNERASNKLLRDITSSNNSFRQSFLSIRHRQWYHQQ